MSQTLLWVDGDLEIDQYTGKSTLIEGPDKAGQDIGESLMTNLVQPAAQYPTEVKPSALNTVFAQVNDLNLPELGSELATIEMPPFFSNQMSKSLVSKKVDESIQRLKRNQKQDPYSTSDERISDIQRLEVEQFEPGGFAFYVQVGLEDTKFNTQKVLVMQARQQVSDDTLSPVTSTILSGPTS